MRSNKVCNVVAVVFVTLVEISILEVTATEIAIVATSRDRNILPDIALLVIPKTT